MLILDQNKRITMLEILENPLIKSTTEINHHKMNMFY